MSNFAGFQPMVSTKGISYNLVEVEDTLFPQFYKRSKTVASAEEMKTLYKWVVKRTEKYIRGSQSTFVTDPNNNLGRILMATMIDLPIPCIAAAVWVSEKNNYIEDDDRFRAFEAFSMGWKRTVAVEKISFRELLDETTWLDLMSSGSFVYSEFRYLYDRKDKLR